MNWLRERIHLMWHVAALCYGAVIGVAAAQWIRADIPGWIAGLAALAIFIIIVKTPQRYMIVLAVAVAVAVGVCVGLARGSGDQAQLTAYEPLIGRQVVLSGTVKDDADVASGGGLRLQIIDVVLGERSLPGQIWVTIAKPGNIKRGDRLRLSGTLRAGFGNYAASLARASVLKIKRVPGSDPALELRDGFAAQVRRAIREPEASLGIGFLLGKKSELPPQLLEALKIAGLTHIIVASGYNLTILVRLARRLFAKVSKFLAMFASVGLIGGFMAVTGLSPSMTRAGLVTGLSLWAWYYGRKFHPVVLLGMALAITTLWNPSYAWGDVGWQLSFAAFAGVIIVAPIMTAYFFGRQTAPAVGQILLETLAAQLVTAPVLLVAFGQISVISLLANLLIVPFIPFTMVLAAGAGVGAMVAPGLAAVLGYPAQFVLLCMIAATYWCAEQPWAQITQQVGWVGAAAWYVVLLAAVGYMKRASGYRLRDASVVE